MPFKIVLYSLMTMFLISAGRAALAEEVVLVNGELVPSAQAIEFWHIEHDKEEILPARKMASEIADAMSGAETTSGGYSNWSAINMIHALYNSGYLKPDRPYDAEKDRARDAAMEVFRIRTYSDAILQETLRMVKDDGFVLNGVQLQTTKDFLDFFFMGVAVGRIPKSTYLNPTINVDAYRERYWGASQIAGAVLRLNFETRETPGLGESLGMAIAASMELIRPDAIRDLKSVLDLFRDSSAAERYYGGIRLLAEKRSERLETVGRRYGLLAILGTSLAFATVNHFVPAIIEYSNSNLSPYATDAMFIGIWGSGYVVSKLYLKYQLKRERLGAWLEKKSFRARYYENAMARGLEAKIFKKCAPALAPNE